MNLLGSETSPYLLQHKDNPVHWQPWGEQAFEQAKKEQKPVLVSIGYSSCHWCHVMEHESFQDESIAEIMNEFFINIKVDREEYPDVDHLYMDAVQAMTGSGGWPLNVFVTPDKKAFYGGTYFPPQRVQNRASWRETLLNVHQYYQQHPTEVQAQAARLIDHLQKINERPVIQTELPSPDLHQIAHKIMAQADTLDGGFGHAPKFPSTHALQFLIQYAHLYKKPAAEEHVFLSLDKMAAGGLYDHLGGGFARYSTDNQWVVPHFEKMLYDNALLLEQYAQAYLITQKPNYKRICVETVEWLVREMTDAEGGFYSAQDADSEGEEGKFYCWTYNELCTILGEEVKLLEAYYHLLPEGNWEHQNIFFTRHSIHDFPVELKPIMGKLFQERKKRIPPLTDTKVILGWNALMAKALVLAGIYCQEEAWIELAESNVHYILKHFKQENGNFWHTRRLGISRITAYADDLVYLMNALVELSKVRGNSSYLEQAIDILELLKTNYKEETSALYSYTHQAFMQTSVNKIDTYDGALPSVNAVLCSVLNYLSDATLNYSLEAEADRMLQVMRPLLDKHPSSFACWALCLLRKNSPWRALHITGTGAAENYKMLLNQLKWNHHVYYVGEQSNINIASFYNVKSDRQFSFCTSLKCLPPLDSMESATRILQED